MYLAHEQNLLIVNKQKIITNSYKLRTNISTHVLTHKSSQKAVYIIM